jgi:hypothetical protein
MQVTFHASQFQNCLDLGKRPAWGQPADTTALVVGYPEVGLLVLKMSYSMGWLIPAFTAHSGVHRQQMLAEASISWNMRRAGLTVSPNRERVLLASPNTKTKGHTKSKPMVSAHSTNSLKLLITRALIYVRF